MVTETTKDQQGISQNYLKFLSTMCGITEVIKSSIRNFDYFAYLYHRFKNLQIRTRAAPKLESCLINPKLKRNAQELLMSICVNCTSNTPEDIEIVGQIVKIRLKTKDLSGFYLECIRYEIFS